ncbi:Rho guanine nucleotide exchange factor 37 [Bienertia sinuspersici]
MVQIKPRIILAWNPQSFKVKILDKTAEIIHCVLQPSGGPNEFYCTFIYAFNEATKRERLWQKLCELKLRQKGPWVLMGDFNVVMNSEERIGSNVRSKCGQMQWISMHVLQMLGCGVDQGLTCTA